MMIKETYPYSAIIAELPTGEEKAIPAGELARRIGAINKRELRLFIERLRGENICICASDCGYYFPKDWDEAYRWKRHMIGVRDKYDALAKSADKYLGDG